MIDVSETFSRGMLAVLKTMLMMMVMASDLIL